ncbi:MAG: hypothetical protein RL385_3912 [Pseudomonadota bacterium]|jgi:hypothetical protein
MKKSRKLCAFALLALTHCTGSERASQPLCAADAGLPAAEALLWKRGTALSNDLQKALALPASGMCKELGTTDCLDVHRVALGSGDPFGSGLLEAVQRPLATSAIAIDRLVLSACSAGVARDAKSSPEVLKDVDLTDAPMPTEEAALTEVTRSVGSALYGALLARDPVEAELDVLRKLATDAEGRPVSHADFAKLACFVIGTTTEHLLY